MCIPSVSWIPQYKYCFFSGKHEGVLNHAIKTRIYGICHFISNHNYKICTRQRQPSTECLTKWSGGLVCPDEDGIYYAVGLYHAEKANCGSSNESIPFIFDTLVTAFVRQKFMELISSQFASNCDDPEVDSQNSDEHSNTLLAAVTSFFTVNYYYFAKIFAF